MPESRRDRLLAASCRGVRGAVPPGAGCAAASQTTGRHKRPLRPSLHRSSPSPRRRSMHLPQAQFGIARHRVVRNTTTAPTIVVRDATSCSHADPRGWPQVSTILSAAAALETMEEITVTASNVRICPGVICMVVEMEVPCTHRTPDRGCRECKDRREARRIVRQVTSTLSRRRPACRGHGNRSCSVPRDCAKTARSRWIEVVHRIIANVHVQVRLPPIKSNRILTRPPPHRFCVGSRVTLFVIGVSLTGLVVQTQQRRSRFISIIPLRCR